MLASPARLVAALGAALLVAPACGGDDEIVDGDPGRIDSGIPDAAGDDAENLCPGALTFEAFAGNLETDAAEFDVAVTEVGDDSNATTSAPNGRVVLCLPADSESEVRAEKADYLTRRDPLARDAAAIYNGAGQPYPLHMITLAAAETLYTDLGTTFEAADAHLVVSVLEYPAGTPLEGATIAIDKAGSAFARDESGAFGDGDAIAGGGLILFANVPTAGGDVEVTVTPPGGFRGTCTGPATLGLVAGGISGALFACQ